MASDEALLALIVDDDQAIVVLAAWGSVGPRLDELEPKAGSLAEVCGSLAEVCGYSPALVARCLRKLRAARVLVDGGITPLADRVLQTRVAERLHTPKSRKSRKA